jgi:hypothetical protein
MQTITSLTKRPALFLAIWAVTLFAAVILAVFLHEDGHGIGARLDGIHISTGFNKVGMPNRTPDDPDFRTGMADGLWSGLLGPLTTWALAIVFTVWLYRFKKPGWAAFGVGALAVANGIARAFPMLMFLLPALRGRIVTVDEAYWGMWAVTHFCRPELATSNLLALAQTQPGLFLAEPIVWVPPLLSLAITSACLIPAYRRILKLWSDVLSRWRLCLLLVLLSLPVWLASMPVLNALDRLIRINW